jgi:two-component system OmpR family response regulator
VAWCAGLFDGEGCISVHFEKQPKKFRLQLRLSMGDEAAGEGRDHQGEEQGEGAGVMLNALIVEDNPTVSERLVELLTVPDRVQVVAMHATEDGAREACERFSIDIAVIDLQLAQGTGFGVIHALRKIKTRPISILVFTMHAVPALKVAAFEAGADFFLDKSKDYAAIPRIVAELLGKAAA